MTVPAEANTAWWTVSIDTGGTFTDAVGRRSDGATILAKVPSTPDDPARGLGDALSALVDDGVPLDAVSLVCHGTTVATNAVLTHQLAKVTLVTTEGFRDVLAYRQGSRPNIYSLTPERPLELIPRERRLEARERVTSSGEVLLALSDEEVDRVVAEVRRTDPEAVAVCLLFGFLNDEHEVRLGHALREALPGVPVSLSSETVREFREYPRMATTTINAALRPLVSGYLVRAQSSLAQNGTTARLLVMQSNGGCTPADRAEGHAHRLILSGPAGGAAGLARLGREHGIVNAISLDMGGTSTDVCLMREGALPLTSSQRIHDHELLAPTVDIHTIGAGGGSIAWVDGSGRLRVGPQSAKARPGPVSYGRGGTEPTLTDAHVVLGTLGSVDLASGLRLDRDAAVASLALLGERLGMPGDEIARACEAAHAVIAISIAHMVRALRTVSIERGLDPREFTLVPFGGAGPLHAGLLLRHLRLRDALIPRHPGLFSAEGLLAAGLRIDDSQTVLATFNDEFAARAREWYADRAQALTRQLLDDGVEEGHIDLSPVADCRYVGQGFELPVPLAGIDSEAIAELPQAFHALHRERYGHSNDFEDIEIVTLRLGATGSAPAPMTPAPRFGGEAPPESARIGSPEIVIPGGDSQRVDVWDRALLEPGNVVRGPAIIHQMDATTVLLAGQKATVTDPGDIRLQEDS
ncbi:MAG: hydantoinase/oxoprolinase family protein [Candidatus Nanopelagicales bacterium]